MHLTVCPMSPFKVFMKWFLWLETYLVALIRYLVYKFLRPAATFNLTPYSMLCNLNFLSGVIYTSLPIFTSLRIARVNTALLAHNLRDGTWQTLSFSITLWMCRERTISWVGILLNEGGAALSICHRYGAVVRQDFKCGFGHCSTQKLGSVLVVGSVVAFLHFLHFFIISCKLYQFNGGS